MIFGLETETANAIFYVSVAAVAIALIVCSSWVLVRWGPPDRGTSVKEHLLRERDPIWSVTTEIRPHKQGTAESPSEAASEPTEGQEP
jgi:hypothetical protein